MISSILVRACLIKFNEWRLRKNNQPRVENIPLEPYDDNTSVMTILQESNDKEKVKNLITNANDNQLAENLFFINMDGNGVQNVELRRKGNKFFMECVKEMETDKASALVWLKRNVDFSTCKKMKSDWNFSGEISYSLTSINNHTLGLQKR